MTTNAGFIGVLLLSGFLGSLGHCLGMCGPLVMMVGIQLKTRGLSVLPNFLLYHSARITIYILLGVIAGALGSLLRIGESLNHFAGAMSMVFGIIIILMGLRYLGWLPIGRLEGGGAWLNRAMSTALKKGGHWGVILMGVLNGLLPCGLVYSALLVAASTGGIITGGLGMLFFGIGTIPALLVIGYGAGSLSVQTRKNFSRIAGILIVIIGLQILLRGAAALGVVPALRLGPLVIW